MYAKLGMTARGNFRRFCSTIRSSSPELAQVINHGAVTYDAMNTLGGMRVNPLGFINSFITEMRLNEHNFQQDNSQNLYTEPYSEPYNEPIDAVPVNATIDVVDVAKEPGILQQASDWIKEYENNILVLGIAAVADMRATAPSTGGHKVAEFKTAFNNALIESALAQVVANQMPPAVFAAINKYVVQRFTDPIMTKIFNHFAVNGQISPELEARILENPNQNLMIAALILMVIIKVLYDQFSEMTKNVMEDWKYPEKIKAIAQQIELIDAEISSPLLAAKKEELTQQLNNVNSKINGLEKEEKLLNQLE
jgi:hypothetical protein